MKHQPNGPLPVRSEVTYLHHRQQQLTESEHKMSQHTCNACANCTESAARERAARILAAMAVSCDEA